jgi:hypothetical protein
LSYTASKESQLMHFSIIAECAAGRCHSISGFLWVREIETSLSNTCRMRCVLVHSWVHQFASDFKESMTLTPVFTRLAECFDVRTRQGSNLRPSV